MIPPIYGIHSLKSGDSSISIEREKKEQREGRE